MRVIRGKWLRFRDPDYVLDFLHAMHQGERGHSITIPGRVNRCTAPLVEYYARYRGECHLFRTPQALKRAMLTVPAVAGERPSRLAQCERMEFVHGRGKERTCSHPTPCEWCREDAGEGRTLTQPGSRPEVKLSNNRRTRDIAEWVLGEIAFASTDESLPPLVRLSAATWWADGEWYEVAAESKRVVPWHEVLNALTQERRDELAFAARRQRGCEQANARIEHAQRMLAKHLSERADLHWRSRRERREK